MMDADTADAIREAQQLAMLVNARVDALNVRCDMLVLALAAALHVDAIGNVRLTEARLDEALAAGLMTGRSLALREIDLARIMRGTDAAEGEEAHWIAVSGALHGFLESMRAEVRR